MTTESEKLTVAYVLVNGSHFFVGSAASPQTLGLCVGSRNLKVAFEQVTPALTFLLKENHGIKTDLAPAMSFAEFQKWAIAKIAQDAGASYMPPVSMADEGEEKIGAALLWGLPKQASKTHHSSG